MFASLGESLGDVIRAEDGEAVFGRIEAIRQASVGFHRKRRPTPLRNWWLTGSRGLSLSETGAVPALLLRLLPADHQYR